MLKNYLSLEIVQKINKFSCFHFRITLRKFSRQNLPFVEVHVGHMRIKQCVYFYL